MRGQRDRVNRGAGDPVDSPQTCPVGSFPCCGGARGGPDGPRVLVRKGIRMQRKRTQAGAVRWAVVPAACLAAVAGAVLVAGTGTARAATFDPGAWSGYVAKGGPYTSVAADFIVPVGLCPA